MKTSLLTFVLLLAGGVLDGKALKKFTPEYPLDAKSAGAGGLVTALITVDERGDVVSAEAVSGRKPLRGPSERAARLSKFAPTTLCGTPVKVSGVITYNFDIM
jgi:periplasmic protein TonB